MRTPPLIQVMPVTDDELNQIGIAAAQLMVLRLGTLLREWAPDEPFDASGLGGLVDHRQQFLQ